jgi:Activator of Hsp90 ATPase homolog 1-like protein
MKQLIFTINITAAKQKVWETMLHPVTYKEWVDAAWPGSFFEGAWKEGENLRFISENGSGTLATLLEYKPYTYIFAKHIAVLNPGGIEDHDSDIAKGWIGTTESYTFTEKNGATALTVELTINPEWAQMFNDGWPKALAKLKEVCER